MLNDPAAERAVLAAICKFGSDVHSDLAIFVKTSSFTVDSNQVVWRCLEHLLKDDPNGEIDYPSVISASSSLGLAGFFDKPTESEHLRLLMKVPVSRANVKRFAVRIQKLEIARDLISCLDVGKDNVAELTGDEPIDRILSAAESPLFELTTRLASAGGGLTTKLSEGGREFMQHLIDNPNQSAGISTGFRHLDAVLGGGLRANSLDLVAARPKTGKSQMANNIALNIARQGYPVNYLDTEMAKEDQLIRTMSNFANIPVNDLERGNIKNPDDIDAAMNTLETLPYFHRSIAGEPIDETLSHLRRWILKEVGLDDNGKAKPCVVIYDYLKLMTSEGLSKGGLSEYQALGFLATSLKDFAARYGIAILGFVQLNRDNDVSQSDRLTWFATSVTHFSRKSEDEQAEQIGSQKYTHKLEPKVARHGAGLEDGDYINLMADYRYGRLSEGPTRNELARKSNRGFVNGGPIED